MKTRLEQLIDEWLRLGVSQNIIDICIATPMIKELEKIVVYPIVTN